jgi:hypothetical protein
LVAGELHARLPGEITLAEAFAQSVNTAAVRVSEAAGRERVATVARELGISAPIAEGPAMALGASEASLLEVTGAYAGILNGGVRARPYGMRELLLKADGSVLMTGGASAPMQVLDERTAGYLTWMMAQVVERGTGTRARLADRPAAGKTGHHLGGAGRLVRGLHGGLRDRGLDGLRRQHAADGSNGRRVAGGRLAGGHGAGSTRGCRPRRCRCGSGDAGHGRGGGRRAGRNAVETIDTVVRSVFGSVVRGLFGSN